MVIDIANVLTVGMEIHKQYRKWCRIVGFVEQL